MLFCCIGSGAALLADLIFWLEDTYSPLPDGSIVQPEEHLSLFQERRVHSRKLQLQKTFFFDSFSCSKNDAETQQAIHGLPLRNVLLVIVARRQ